MSVHATITAIRTTTAEPEHVELEQEAHDTLAAAHLWTEHALTVEAAGSATVIVHMWFGDVGAERDLFRYTGPATRAVQALVDRFGNSSNYKHVRKNGVNNGRNKPKELLSSHCLRAEELIEFI